MLEPEDTGRHVLIACHAWYGDVTGGAFRLATDLAVYLAEHGWRVSYVCCSPSGVARECEQVSGVHVYRYPAPVGGNRLRRMWHHISHTGRLADRIHNEVSPVDVINSHSPLQGLGVAHRLRSVVPFINYTVHSPFADELLSNVSGSPGPSHRIAAFLARQVDRWNVRFADRVQTDSQWTYDRLAELFGRSLMCRKGVVVPAWVEVDRFIPVWDRRASRRSMEEAWQTELPVFFTLRRLEHRMGLDLLIHASSLLVRDGFRFRVLIGGSGSLQDSLQRQIEESNLQGVVKLLGRLPESVVPACYAAADCFVLPTRALECFGLIVLEAFACNTPVLGSRAAAIPELVELQGNGWLFNVGDSEQLAAGMRAFLSDELVGVHELPSVARQYSAEVLLPTWKRLLC